jgi:ketosteroid isomerase-like protein
MVMERYTYKATSSADASLIEAVQQVGNRWTAGLAQGDVQPIAVAYGKNARAYVPASGLLDGKEAIVAGWRQAIKDGLRHVAIETHEVAQDGALGYETGIYAILDQQGAVTERGHYLIIWRQENGHWQWHRHIWNYQFKVAG